MRAHTYGAQITKLPLKGSAAKIFPTLCGLCSIPFIVTPIDEGVHALADVTYKPILKKAFPVE